jgi:hypothetical protein
LNFQASSKPWPNAPAINLGYTSPNLRQAV